VWSGGVLYQDAYYVGDLQGFIYSINAATGKQNWRVQPGGTIISAIVGSPLLVNEQLVFSSENDTVYFISLEGKVVDSQVVSGTLYAAPYAAGDLILIAPINSDILLAALTANGTQQWTYMPAK